MRGRGDGRDATYGARRPRAGRRQGVGVGRRAGACLGRTWDGEGAGGEEIPNSDFLSFSGAGAANSAAANCRKRISGKRRWLASIIVRQTNFCVFPSGFGTLLLVA